MPKQWLVPFLFMIIMAITYCLQESYSDANSFIVGALVVSALHK